MNNIHQVKAYFGDTDAAGIVFYPNFYKWMDQATTELVGKNILPTPVLFKEKHILLPLIETFCKYYSPIYFEDVVDIYSEITKITDRTIRVEHVFKREGEIVAKGYEVKAWTKKKEDGIKSESIPDKIKQLIK
ncbi:acyl-CoA thioesterase [Oceanobacillus sp. 1P07AA]|uniref:acyl-CoA thioesterase n=1 Tax=Oceanobacillus sp. 1P07AA TaxID=3132293 RepID=UPI0039A69B54